MDSQPARAPGIGFGAELRRLRRDVGMSLATLATAVNYSKGQLSKIENGLARPHPDLARACDMVLGTGGALQGLIQTSRACHERQQVEMSSFSGLPRESRHFTGRAKELAEVVDSLTLTPTDTTARTCVVHGMPGIGKTALAVRAAHLLADQFMNGCLYLDLHGHTPGVRPVSAMEALDRCLRRLGVSGENIPRTLDDRAGLFRSRLTGRRLLLVLDDPVDLEHVEPLLPASAGCGVLITSRRWLAGLDDAEHVELGVLPMADGIALFRAVGGADADPAIESIVRRCGLLPLTIRVAAARFRAQPEKGLPAYAHRLGRSLRALTDGDRTAIDLFATSLRNLPPAQRDLFIALATHPGVDFGGHAAAALGACPLEVACQSLYRLADAHLLTRHAPERFGFHDLIREYALDQAKQSSTTEPTRRLADFYVTSAHSADCHIAPHRYHRPLDPTVFRRSSDPPEDRDSAVRWMDQEFDNLAAMCERAAAAGLDEHCWRIAHSLQGYAFLTKAWDAWIAVQRMGLAAAQRLGDSEAEGYLLNGLGLAHLERHDTDRAAEYFKTAFALYTAIGDERGLSNTLGNWAWVHFRRGDNEAALRAHEQALQFHRRSGSAIPAAITLRGLAVAELGLGHHTAAVDYLTEALDTFDEHNLPLDRAMALNCLGDTHYNAGALEAAEIAYRAAAEACLACGSRFEYARALEGLAAVTEDETTARQHRDRATALYAELGAPEAVRTRTMPNDQ